MYKLLLTVSLKQAFFFSRSFITGGYICLWIQSFGVAGHTYKMLDQFLYEFV